ncbi:TrkA family potassium uptake protein [Litorilinea aerophila]|uniref:TrkA family potassium uptake protein n=1 Tax=Litorilinea aerophila TaxID=1204385 RepID=A0A540VCU8_9CHLR|nr:TrkA family potassium uptake protein [Litorilinea aerophila]MCC9077628.1 TrkA family potassium uptake protein [Litorilinea aerophila]GIV79764.1 MAG: potassium transporter Trk [Litorilinea sp.]
MTKAREKWLHFLNRLNPLGTEQVRPPRRETEHGEAVLPYPAAKKGKTNEYVVIGLGRFGTSVAKTLVSYGRNVLAIDSDYNRVQELSTSLPHVIQLDATNYEALKQAGVDEFDTGLVCIGTDFESNVLATVLLNRLGVQRVIAKARTRTQKEILLRVGADEVILPEHEAGVRLARKLAAGHFIDYLEVSNDVGIVELVAPSSFWGHTFAELALRQRYGLTAMAVRRGSELIVSPSANFRIEPNDILVVLGKIEDAERLNQ